MTEVIEGTAVEIVPEIRAVAVVQQPGQSLVAQTNDPADMVAVASRLATVLRDIVDRQHLYTVIQGKSYPHVEAWQTIGRLDNVVAREARPPDRGDDGAWTAYAEIIRLSDGMVIGSASAMCGGPDDEPWGGSPAKNGRPAKGPRPENARRSMAATRAISRAFRGQYAWIMVLAGYQPTPAEEMPHTPTPGSPPPASPSVPAAGPPPGSGDTSDPIAISRGFQTYTGKVLKGDGAYNNLTATGTPDGYRIGFRLDLGAQKIDEVVCDGPIGLALYALVDDLKGAEVFVEGEAFRVEQAGRRTRARLVVSKIAGPFGTFPGDAPPAMPDDGKVNDLDSLPW